MYNCGVIGIESWTISHTFAVIFAATAPHPRWRRKPCNGLLSSNTWYEGHRNKKCASSSVSNLQVWQNRAYSGGGGWVEAGEEGKGGLIVTVWFCRKMSKSTDSSLRSDVLTSKHNFFKVLSKLPKNQREETAHECPAGLPLWIRCIASTSIYLMLLSRHSGSQWYKTLNSFECFVIRLTRVVPFDNL